MVAQLKLTLHLRSFRSGRRPVDVNMVREPLHLYRRIAEETRTGLNLRAVEAILEAAPQFFLQLYLLTLTRRSNCKVSKFDTSI